MDDIKKRKDDNGNWYYQLELRETKTRKGKEAGQVCSLRPQAGALKYCPVHWLSYDLDHAPTESKLLYVL
jgi:hypothetical protein